MMSVELGKTADMLSQIGGSNLGSLASTLRHYEGTIRDAVWAHTRNSDGVFAYETNGYGSAYYMDDANVPSLVGLPYVGFLERNDSSYVKTKNAMFSRDNPYYAVGKNFTGIG
jgi:meiotically up-regulated gene 157 (Mug157) protein